MCPGVGKDGTGNSPAVSHYKHRGSFNRQPQSMHTHVRESLSRSPQVLGRVLRDNTAFTCRAHNQQRPCAGKIKAAPPTATPDPSNRQYTQQKASQTKLGQLE